MGHKYVHNLHILARMKLKVCTQTLIVNIKITTKLHVCKQQQTASGNRLLLGHKYVHNLHILARMKLKVCTLLNRQHKNYIKITYKITCL